MHIRDSSHHPKIRFPRQLPFFHCPARTRIKRKKCHATNIGWINTELPKNRNSQLRPCNFVFHSELYNFLFSHFRAKKMTPCIAHLLWHSIIDLRAHTSVNANEKLLNKQIHDMQLKTKNVLLSSIAAQAIVSTFWLMLCGIFVSFVCKPHLYTDDDNDRELVVRNSVLWITWIVRDSNVINSVKWYGTIAESLRLVSAASWIAVGPAGHTIQASLRFGIGH